MTYVGPAIAVVALTVSIVSFVVNRRAADTAERHGRMPVLIPVSPIPRNRITIRNVGRGPALNVVIAHAVGELAARDAPDIDLSDPRYGSMWEEPRHLQPIEPGTECSYEWPYREAVGLTYTDALGAPYTTLTGGNGTKVGDGRSMPKWPLSGLEFPEVIDVAGGNGDGSTAVR